MNRSNVLKTSYGVLPSLRTGSYNNGIAARAEKDDACSAIAARDAAAAAEEDATFRAIAAGGAAAAAPWLVEQSATAELAPVLSSSLTPTHSQQPVSGL